MNGRQQRRNRVGHKEDVPQCSGVAAAVLMA